jgi:hypothetical protein
MSSDPHDPNHKYSDQDNIVPGPFIRMPVVVEPMSALALRYRRALVKVWDTIPKMKALTWYEDRPGLHRDHVFDLESNTRFVISRHRKDEHDRVGRVIHVSMSRGVAGPSPESVGDLLLEFCAISGREIGEIKTPETVDVGVLGFTLDHVVEH